MIPIVGRSCYGTPAYVIRITASSEWLYYL